MPTKSAHAKAQKRHVQRKLQDGFKRRAIWVPPYGVEDFDKAVARLRRKWNKEQAARQSA